MRRFLIQLLGGYADIEEAIDAVREDKDKVRILTLAVKDLFNTINEDDILKEVHGQWLFEGKPMNGEQMKLLMSEAAVFEKTTLWKVLQKDIEWQANRKMFILSRTEMEMTGGKLWKFTFDAFRTRLRSLSKGGGSFNSK